MAAGDRASKRDAVITPQQTNGPTSQTANPGSELCTLVMILATVYSGANVLSLSVFMVMFFLSIQSRTPVFFKKVPFFHAYAVEYKKDRKRKGRVFI